MRRFLLDLLPQMFDRVEVRRVRRQLLNGQAIGMGIEKVRHGGAGMIAGSVLNHDDMTPRLSQHVEEKSRIACRVKPSLVRFVEKLSGKVIDQAKDFVAL